MAEKIISPAVTFKETDLSTIPQEFDQIDGVFVGSTPKGKYFVPQTVNSFREYEEKFGGVSEDDYTGLAVREYIREKGSATVMPVANTEGYSNPNVWNVVVSSGSVDLTVAQLYSSQGGQNNSIDSASVSGSLEDFTIETYSSTTTSSVESNLSLYDSDTNFLGEYTNPTSTNKDFYVKYMVDINNLNGSSGGFENAVSSTSTDISLEQSSGAISGSAYQEGNSPWIVSQDFGSDQYHKLFRFKTRQEGDQANRKLKFEIDNVRLPSELNNPDAEYGKFDVIIRDYSDTEGSTTVLETFEDVDLNPESNDYIVREIGDMHYEFDNTEEVLVEKGLYDNASDFVWVEISDNIDDVPANAIPYGFESYDHAGSFFQDAQAPSYLVYPDNGEGKTAGVDFDGLKDFYLNSLHKELPQTDQEFYDSGEDDVDEYFVLSSSVTTGSVGAVTKDSRRFVFGAFGASKGEDETLPKNTGEDMTSSNTMGFDFQNSGSNGSKSYKRALDILSDDETYDMSMLVMPAINMDQHSWIVGEAISMVEARADVFLVVDATGFGKDASVAEKASNGFDSTYAGCYFPWINMNNQGKVEPVPPSVLVPSAFAYNDRVAHPWYATLGFNRGTLSSAIKPYKKLRKATRDDLIQSNVNPITSILGEGTVILGQETLQKRETALSKINVRRLLIEAKKFISTVAWQTIGEPNNATTRGQLESIINNYLEGVRRDNGLERFRVDFSDDVNTPDVVNRNLVRGVIELVPTKAVEGIQINFVIRNSGVSFND